MSKKKMMPWTRDKKGQRPVEKEKVKYPVLGTPNEAPTLPNEARFHSCAACGKGGTPWYGTRGDHPTHDPGMGFPKPKA